MTREQAKREIDSLDYYLQNHTDDYSEESHTAMMMALSALSENVIIDVPDTATNEDVMNETLRRVFPKTIFIRSQSIANKTQAINMSDEWLGRKYKEMYK